MCGDISTHCNNCLNVENRPRSSIIRISMAGIYRAVAARVSACVIKVSFCELRKHKHNFCLEWIREDGPAES